MLRRDNVTLVKRGKARGVQNLFTVKFLEYPLAPLNLPGHHVTQNYVQVMKFLFMQMIGGILIRASHIVG